MVDVKVWKIWYKIVAHKKTHQYPVVNDFFQVIAKGNFFLRIKKFRSSTQTIVHHGKENVKFYNGFQTTIF